MTGEPIAPPPPDVFIAREGRVLEACKIAACLALIAFLVYAALILRKFDRETLPLANAALEKQSTGWDADRHQLAEKGGRVIDQAETAVGNLGTLVSRGTTTLDHLDTTVLPATARTMGHVEATAAQVERSTAETAKGVSPLLSTTQANVQRQFDDLHQVSVVAAGSVTELTALTHDIRGDVSGDQVELHRALEALALTSEHLTVISEPAAYESITKGAGDTLGNLAGITADGRRITDYYTARILPVPYRPTGNLFVRSLKTAGHYTWQVVRASPELTLLFLKLAAVK